MLSSFDKLIRMLTQEKRLGYKNKAVFGGLERLAPNWASEALEEVSSPDQQQVVEEVVDSLYRYPEVSEEARPRYIHQLLVKLHKSTGPLASDQEKAAEKPVQPDPEPTQEEETPAEDEASPEEAQEDTAATDEEVSESRALPPQEAEPESPRESKHYPSARSDNNGFANAGLEAPVTKLPGIKTAMAKKLANLGVYTIQDFLQLYPRRYDDYRSLKTINQLEYGEEVTIIAQVWETRKRDVRNRMTIVTSILSDGTATIEASWFNQPWLVNKLRPGTQIVISGKVDQYMGRLTFQSPEWEELDADQIHTGRIVPVYPLTQGITAKWLRAQIKSTVDYWASRLTDYLPAETTQRLNLPGLSRAIRQIHFPHDWKELEQARRRLAFDELLMIQMGVLKQRQAWQSLPGQAVNIQTERLEQILQALPFALTEAQRKALDSIIADLGRGVPMSRLLQGDVGSGKTVVALIAMVLVALDGGQAAILAPTEILAEQHFKSMGKMLQTIGETVARPLNIQLLTGSSSAAERNEIAEALGNGQLDLLVGTHAIIQENVTFKDLRLAIIDEQHRFGVAQRAALREKGSNPHMLVMTATPIPRTLALTLYGDLDLSLIDEMPPGRQPIKTYWLGPAERERAYNFIRAHIEKGRQAFIICPLVEESENTEAKSAVEEHKRLQKEVFPRLKLGLLHGRMKAEEKDQVMKAFRDRELHILVSTSVVEVGIDVPNATVILIEGANRFGLAQLHQFRGRVGRGEYKSYCLLQADKLTPEAQQRLEAVEATNDGFELAEYDLKMRGPGEFFGTRQSGLPDLKLVKLTDTRLLEIARNEAQQIFNKDGALQTPEYRLLAQQVANFWKMGSDLS